MIPKEILEKVRRIELTTRGLVSEIFAGEYHSVFKGRGMEFAEVKEYTFGDDIRNIDWNVTARMGKPYVKQFDEERELTVILAVDVSGSEAFGSHQQLKREVAAELCAVIAFAAIKNNDKVGLVMFTDEVEKYIPPRKGKKHVLRVIRELLYFRPGKKGTDISEALQFINRMAKRRATVFLVSDFLDEGFDNSLRILRRKHDVIAARISDPLEALDIPAGWVEMEDAETGEIVAVNIASAKFSALYSAEYGREDRRLKDSFRSLGIDAIDINTRDNYIDPLVQFFKMRNQRRKQRN
jgi:uncharacterized protein (DUF58 family)